MVFSLSGEKMRTSLSILVRISIILLFISCTTNTGTNPDNLSVVNATFSSIQQNVFTNSCAFSNCHAGSVSPTLSSGNAYGNIVNQISSNGKAYIKPSDPANSYLLSKIKGQNIRGSRMPLNGNRLTQSVIDSITTWIQNGALNN